MINAAPLQQGAELSNIQVNRMENQLETRLETNAPINYESFTLFNPNRLVIDLLQVQSFSCAPEINIAAFGVIKIRTAKNQPDVTRVVFDLEDNVPAYSIEEKDNGLYIYFRQEVLREEQPAVVEETIEQPVRKVTPKVTRTETPPPPPPVQQQQKEISLRSENNKKLYISVGGGLYFPHDADFQEIYGTSSLAFGGGIGFILPLSNKEDLGIALDFNYIGAKGLTSETEEDLEFTMMPFSLTVYYSRHIGIFAPFGGIGADYINYKETYPETIAISETTGSVFGYNLLLGSNIHIIDNLAVKLYVKLHMAKKTEEEYEINLSGNEYGIGLTYYFNF